MEGFDAIYYEEEIENNEEIEPADISLVPDPVVIRGAGNMTVYVNEFSHVSMNFLITSCILLFFSLCIF